MSREKSFWRAMGFKFFPSKVSYENELKQYNSFSFPAKPQN